MERPACSARTIGRFDRALQFAHYERITPQPTPTDPMPLPNVPLGGIKGRMNQCCAAMGRVQLENYPKRMQQIQDALNRFWNELDGTPGMRAHRPDEYWPDSTMGGWYSPVGRYLSEELGGLPVERFVEAVNAEGGRSGMMSHYMPAHLHPVFGDVDIYRDGRPTRIAFAARDIRQAKGSLPVSETLVGKMFRIPYFKHDRPDAIGQYASAYRKVAINYERLL